MPQNFFKRMGRCTEADCNECCDVGAQIYHEEKWANGEVAGFGDCWFILSEFTVFDGAPLEHDGVCYTDLEITDCALEIDDHVWTNPMESCEIFNCTRFRAAQVVIKACDDLCTGELTIGFGVETVECSCTGEIVCTYPEPITETVTCGADPVEDGLECVVDPPEIPCSVLSSGDLTIMGISVSDPITEEETRDAAIAALDPFTNSFTTTGLPSSYITEICDGQTQVQRAQFKFTFTPPASGGFKIVWTIEKWITPVGMVDSWEEEWVWTPNNDERCLEQETPIQYLEPPDIEASPITPETYYHLTEYHCVVT